MKFPLKLDAEGARSILQRIDELQRDERRKAWLTPRARDADKLTAFQAADAIALNRLIGALQEHLPPAEARAFDDAQERLEGPS